MKNAKDLKIGDVVFLSIEGDFQPTKVYYLDFNEKESYVEVNYSYVFLEDSQIGIGKHNLAYKDFNVLKLGLTKSDITEKTNVYENFRKVCFLDKTTAVNHAIHIAKNNLWKAKEALELAIANVSEMEEKVKNLHLI